MSPEQRALDGALVAVVSTALHERCVRQWDARKGTDPSWAQTFHGPQAHDHGALDVVAALRDQGWICTHGDQIPVAALRLLAAHYRDPVEHVDDGQADELDHLLTTGALRA